MSKGFVFIQQTLIIFTFDAFPQQWAMTQNNLANAYLYRIRGDKAENLEKAIAAFTEALKVLTYDAFPQEWAMRQNNLASAYRDRIKGEKVDNLEQAIAAYTEALKVYTFDAFPQEWATTQNNLALAYRDRIRGEKAENLEYAIAAYTEALKVRTYDAFPQDCLVTARNLANLHYDRKQWQPATEAYHTAIEAVENARLEALNPQSRQEVLSNAIDVFHRIVQAYLNLNQLSNLLQTFADTLHINEIISLIPETCQRLIIIPHWFLHILPLHALPIDPPQPPLKKGESQLILQDKYDVQYAPSCQLLQITKQRQLNELTNLFAIQNPTKDLTFTDLEFNIISTLFNQSEIIAKDNAKKESQNWLQNLTSQQFILENDLMIDKLYSNKPRTANLHYS